MQAFMARFNDARSTSPFNAGSTTLSRARWLRAHWPRRITWLGKTSHGGAGELPLAGCSGHLPNADHVSSPFNATQSLQPSTMIEIAFAQERL
jgi:hypothetical protein